MIPTRLSPVSSGDIHEDAVITRQPVFNVSSSVDADPVSHRDVGLISSFCIDKIDTPPETDTSPNQNLPNTVIADCLNQNNNSIMDWITKQHKSATTTENAGNNINNNEENKSQEVKSLYEMSLSSLMPFLNMMKKLKFDCDKSVINLSSFQLNRHHISLLSKGLSFCPTPGEPDLGELRRDLDEFHRNVLLKSHFEKDIPKAAAWKEKTTGSTNPPDKVTSKAQLGPFSHRKFTKKSLFKPDNPKGAVEAMISCNELHFSSIETHSPLKQNLTRDERKAMRELSKNPNIVIKKADKGSAVVIMNRDDYIAEGMSQLQNTKFYREVDHDLTLEHNVKINDKLETYKKSGEISEKTFEYLHNDMPRTSKFYMLPKIHKNLKKPPGRPIVSANDSPTEKISEFVDFFLQPLLPKLRSYVQDTTHLINILRKLAKLPKGTRLVVADVTSLYTNIITAEGIEAVRKFLKKHRITSAKPSNEMLCDLLELTLTLNNFEFNERHFLQVGGTAMGTRVAPSLANIFMSEFEEKFVYTYELQPVLFKRYIDDCIFLWTHGDDELTKFIDHLNTCHPTIKFTTEISTESVNFLDTTISMNSDDDVLETSVYFKPTDSHDYLYYTSAHPPHTKRSLPYSQFLRLRRICTHDADFIKSSITLCMHFLRRGYPAKQLQDNLLNCIKQKREDLLTYSSDMKTDEEGVFDDTLYFIHTYCPEFNEAIKIVKSNWDLLKRSSATKVLADKRVICGHRRPKNLKDHLVRAKLPVIKQDKCKTAPNSQTRNKCSNLKCNYCPLINKTGEITSTKTNRKYSCKKNVTCRSSNLIYCIHCKVCKKQYVGQTGDPIIKRFQGHFTSIRSKDLSNDIGRHYNLEDHTGTKDIEIYVLDFIYAPPKTEFALTLRLQIEFNWIHRLRTMLPWGINTKDRTPLSKGCRNWRNYRN